MHRREIVALQFAMILGSECALAAGLPRRSFKAPPLKVMPFETVVAT